MGIFGNLFDFNCNGKLDTLEQATEFSFFMNMIDQQEQEKKPEKEEFDEISEE